MSNPLEKRVNLGECQPALIAAALAATGSPNVPLGWFPAGPGVDDAALKVKDAIAAADTRRIAPEQRRAALRAASIVIVDKALAMNIDNLFLPALDCRLPCGSDQMICVACGLNGVSAEAPVARLPLPLAVAAAMLGVCGNRQ
jgi:hypothetical protein